VHDRSERRHDGEALTVSRRDTGSARHESLVHIVSFTSRAAASSRPTRPDARSRAPATRTSSVLDTYAPSWRTLTAVSDRYPAVPVIRVSRVSDPVRREVRGRDRHPRRGGRTRRGVHEPASRHGP
jgi:hypothetical protein